MTPAYRWLTITIVAAALALAFFVRAPKTTPRPAPSIPAAAESLALEIARGAIRPDRTVVPKGTALTLSVRNRDDVPRQFSLAGYEDRPISKRIGARETAVILFRADRPGEDFAWLVDGRPAGRLVVAGSHLEEGHQ